jgi:uncharacterized membrane protein
MSPYLWIKLVHIISATILFGTGLGIAFFMLKAYLSGNQDTMVVTTRNVVLADWIFTTPAVVIQFASGLWLTQQIGIPFDSVWFVLVVSLFVLVGGCWVPVVWIQLRIRDIVASNVDVIDCRRLMSVWMVLGAVAFSGVLLLFFLMVFRVGVDQPVFS